MPDLRHDDDTALTFKRADQALYRAKEAGRNRCLVADAAGPVANVAG